MVTIIRRTWQRLDNYTVPVGRMALVPGLALLALGLLAGCKEGASSSASGENGAEAGAQAETPPPRPLVTQAHLDKLLYDMPYKKVEEFLGMEPTRQESTYKEGVDGYTRPYLISWYIWENPDGSFIKLGFTNDLLIEMEGEDLPEGAGAGAERESTRSP